MFNIVSHILGRQRLFDHRLLIFHLNFFLFLKKSTQKIFAGHFNNTLHCPQSTPIQFVDGRTYLGKRSPTKFLQGLKHFPFYPEISVDEGDPDSDCRLDEDQTKAHRATDPGPRPNPNPNPTQPRPKPDSPDTDRHVHGR